MHGTTEISKRYDPPAVSDGNIVDVRISVEGADGDEALELADDLLDAAEDAHAKFRSDDDRFPYLPPGWRDGHCPECDDIATVTGDIQHGGEQTHQAKCESCGAAAVVEIHPPD